VTPSVAVERLVDELAGELDPTLKSSAAVQLKVLASSKVRFRIVERLVANIGSNSTTSVRNRHAWCEAAWVYRGFCF
jgi:hypothetical protein